jgi:hypothetical protein
MASDSEIIALGTTDPALTYKLSHFIKIGRESPTISYTDLSYRETHDNISYVIKNVLNDYIPELKKLSRKVLLSDKEYDKYKYKPKILSYDIYGNTEYYIYILMINDMCNIYEFDTKKLLLIPKTILNNALASIYRSEKANLLEYNNTHN